MAELERLARVGVRTVRRLNPGMLGWKMLGARQRHREVERVRAILTAMREPTQTQYDALCATDKMWREQTSEAVWKTYIDALLKD